jgi:DNA-binding NarL/FixJ family response regulator
MAEIKDRISKLDQIIAQAEERKSRLTEREAIDLKIVDAYTAGASVSDIAAALETNPGNIYWVLRRAKVERRAKGIRRAGAPVKTKINERDSGVIDAHKRGYTLGQIGKQFSITRERVRQILLRAGISDRNGFESFSTAIESRNAEIATAYVGGEEIADLAVKHDLSYGTVQNLILAHPISRETYQARTPRRIAASKARQLVLALAEAYRSGASVKTIADAYGMSTMTVYSRLKESGCQMRPKGNRGHRQKSSTEEARA